MGDCIHWDFSRLQSYCGVTPEDGFELVKYTQDLIHSPQKYTLRHHYHHYAVSGTEYSFISI